MRSTITIIILLFSSSFALIVEIMIRKGKLKRVTNYSYEAVIQVALRAILIAIIISSSIYYFSSSFEAALTVGVFFFFCILAGSIKSFYLEYRIKARRGRNEDHK